MCLKGVYPAVTAILIQNIAKITSGIDSGFRYLQGFPNMFRYQTHISWHKHEQTMTLRQQKVPQFVRKARPGLINVIHLGGLPAVNCGCPNSPGNTIAHGYSPTVDFGITWSSLRKDGGVPQNHGLSMFQY